MAVTTIIQGVKEYIEDYSELAEDAPVWVNYLGTDPIEYSIVPLPGGGPVTVYVNGSGIYEFFFAFQSVNVTNDDVTRLATIGFYEMLKDWLKAQSDAGTFPEMPAGKTPTKIEALGDGSLFEQGQSSTGVYQIQCRLEYSI